MWHTYGDHFWGMHFFWWIFWVIVISVVFVLLKSRRPAEKETPEQILRKRFARGEISKEEYEEKKKVLQDN